jgi:hypothetical protein
MSRDIWTRCAGPSRDAPIACRAWRVVEAQHKVMTRRLVDGLDEQILLEEIVDDVKPPRPPGAQFERLHFLLFTPFRHPPLKGGSRFGAPGQRGLWYGARLLETCLAEKAYYQILFAAGTTAQLKNLSCLWSAYQAEVKAKRAISRRRPSLPLKPTSPLRRRTPSVNGWALSCAPPPSKPASIVPRGAASTGMPSRSSSRPSGVRRLSGLRRPGFAA